MKRDNNNGLLSPTDILNIFKEIIRKNTSVPVGVLFISIPNKSSILVFKTYLGPLQRIKYYYAPGTTQIEQRESEGFVSYWKGEFTENKLPSIINQYYPVLFTMSKLKNRVEEMPRTKPRKDGKGLIIPVRKLLYDKHDAEKNTIKPYDPNNLPKGCYEVKLDYILNPGLWPKTENIERKRYKSVREIFKECNLIPEVRGKSKKITTEKARRNEAIVKLDKAIRKKKKTRMRPIKEIQERLDLQYDVSDATVRRILKKNNR